MSAAWQDALVVRDRLGQLRHAGGFLDAPIGSGLDPLEVAVFADTFGPMEPILGRAGQPIVRMVGDLTARHQLTRPRIRVAGREGTLKVVKPSDEYPGTLTLIWGDWWEVVSTEEPCEVLP